MWDTTTIVAVTGAVSASAGGLIGVLCTKGVDAYLRIRKAKADEDMAEKTYDASQEAAAFQQATAAYEKLISAFEARITALETALSAVGQELQVTRKQHLEAVIEQERLRGELKALQVHVDRLWSHDSANKQNVDGLKAKVQEVEGKLSDSGVAKP